MKKLFLILPFFVLFAFYSCDDEPIDSAIITANTNTGGSNNNGGNTSGGGTNTGGSTNNNDSASLTGDWHLISFEISVNNSVEIAGQVTTTEFIAEDVQSDYTLTFMDNGTYSTSGSYSLSTQVSVAGVQVSNSTDDYTNISGSGNYSVNGSILTVDGSFFEVTYNGIDDSALGGEQQMEYTLSNNNNTLTINQNQETQDNSSGASITSNVSAVSVWERL